ncbi:guanine-1-methyltransferase-domain-containing protein [Pelagophyceae sp. CCMP2097]|nr:guanine-1-methyltransferase-domain-containing protein [Pelagophyceae sp. CCMP2097]
MSNRARKRAIRDEQWAVDAGQRVAAHRIEVEERAAKRLALRADADAAKPPAALAAEAAAQSARSALRRSERDKHDAAYTAAAAASIWLAVDCEFEDRMTTKEVTSFCSQVMHCYAATRRASSPCTCQLIGLPKESASFRHLQRVTGFGKWLGFDVDHRPLADLVRSSPRKLVYLTADAEDELDGLDQNVVYVIGGIVDRNRHKGLTKAKAESLGLSTARLPIGPESLIRFKAGASSPVLTVNHVFELMLQRHLTGSWAAAAIILPGRKLEEARQTDHGDDEYRGSANGDGAQYDGDDAHEYGDGAHEKEQDEPAARNDEKQDDAAARE